MADILADPAWPAIQSFADGDHVDAATLNRPIQELAARTEHLRRLLEMNDRTKVAVTEATLSDPDGTGAVPKVGKPVYRCADGTYALAIGAVGENEWFYADQRAMAVGVIGSVSGTTATIVLCGYLPVGLAVSNLIADSNPVSGRYYLSNTQVGKLTANPSGPVIYVCDCMIRDGRVVSMIVNPQYRDTGESHIHRSFILDWKPMGGYGVKWGTSYGVYGCLPDGVVPGADGKVPGQLRLYLYGAWDTDAEITYTFRIERKAGASTTSTAWSDYQVRCTADTAHAAEEGETVIPLSSLSSDGTWTSYMSVGQHKLRVRFNRPAGNSISTPTGMVGTTWTVAMPDAGRGWMGVSGGFQLNLGMYPVMARYVPLVPENSGALVVGGLEMRGPVFGAANREWYIRAADSAGGPWLTWVGNAVVADSVTTPWVWTSNTTPATARNIVLHAGRMRVGPTGFVTSLQPAPGSPLRITSALTDTNAMQGALQIGMDIDFKSADGNVAGSQVVKRINGTTFETGPVVERVIAGPGLAVNQEQGSVRVSVSNAVYAGDFETIALKNAKQDLAGGVFPYTKLLGWATTGANIDSGFTAKFRVPDHIPYNAGRGYYVVVSASVFGEEAKTGTAVTVASFSMRNYILGDQACSPDASLATAFDGSIASPTAGRLETVGVPFAGPYGAYDPILVHGFRSSSEGAGPGTIVLPDGDQRKAVDALWLKDSLGNPLKVFPGYFVGLDIRRCATVGTAYTAPIGFMSLRWNLVEVPEA